MSRAQRAFDIVGASAGLAAFAPAMAVIAAAVLIADGPPVFFRQERVGYRRRPFRIVKFRSMRDGRVTRVGRLLRATGLDELPQFVNILRGHMRAVGPRPLTAADVVRLGWSGAQFDFRWSCRPGLTGLAQLVGAFADDDAWTWIEFTRADGACRSTVNSLRGPSPSTPSARPGFDGGCGCVPGFAGPLMRNCASTERTSHH